MPKKIFTQELEGTRRRGRPRKRWKEEVERDLQVVGLRRWRELVADREKNGRTLFDRPKPTVGCSADGRRRTTTTATKSTTTTWTLGEVDQKHLQSSEMWCWRRMEMISWTDRVRNAELLLRVKEQRDCVNGRLTGLVTFCIETAFHSGLLKER